MIAAFRIETPNSVYLQCCFVSCVYDAFSPSLLHRAPAGSLRSLTPPSVACERWMARLSPGPTSRCGTAGEDRGGGTAEMRMGGERGRSYKLRRNSGYLTPACLSSTINHAQELRCVLSLLWPSAALIHLQSFSWFFSLLR